MNAVSLDAARQAVAGRDAPEMLAWAEASFGARAVIASSFGAEDMVLIDLAAKHAPSLAIFTLDTGRLPPETYEVMEAVRARYGVQLRTYAPDTAEVEALVRAHGFFSFRDGVAHRKQCCAVRKLGPLRRALEGRAAWITGLRREQSPTRDGVEPIEVDAANGGLLKLNPLAAWTTEDVWNHIRAHRVPYHPLHDRGFPSVGCAPCTRAVAPGEDLRAGRWWWESPEHKECGLHARS